MFLLISLISALMSLYVVTTVACVILGLKDGLGLTEMFTNISDMRVSPPESKVFILF